VLKVQWASAVAVHRACTHNHRAALTRNAGLSSQPETTFQTLVRKLQNLDSATEAGLCEMLMSWGDVWMTVRQASSRRSLIKRLIN